MLIEHLVVPTRCGGFEQGGKVFDVLEQLDKPA